jgi:hypothetical protein
MAEDTEEMALQKASKDFDNYGVRSLLAQGDVSQESDIFVCRLPRNLVSLGIIKRSPTS